MQKEEMESDLIGFENDFPIMKKLKLEVENVGKQIILNGDALSGKLFILNSQNVKIPVKVCGAVPENVRKVVLSKLPVKEQEDKKHVVYGKSDNISYQIKDKATSVERGTLLSCKNVAEQATVNNKSTVVPQNEIVKTKENKTIEMETKNNQTKVNQRRKRRILSPRQTIQREVMKCLKQSMKSHTKPAVKTRSVSSQTDSVQLRDSDCQTENNSNTFDPFTMDILSLFEESDNSEKFPLVTGNSPMYYPEGVGHITLADSKRLKFYQSLKNSISTDSTGHIPLHLGVLNEDPTEVHNQCLLLKARNLSVDVPNDNGQTPLHLAVLHGCDVKIIEILLRNGADPLMKDAEGNSSLHNAVMGDDRQILITLLNSVKNKKEKIDVFNYEGFTPLMLCVIEEKNIMAQDCIDAGANPNTKDQKSGRTSLFHAVENNNLDMVRLFMQKGANTKIKNFFGTSTHEATFELESINPEIKSLVIGKDIWPNRSKKTQKNKHIVYKNRLKTVRILKIIDKEATK